MSGEDKKKRGGARPNAGRKKAAPPPAVLDGRSAEARGIAHRVLQRAKVERLWLAIIRRERERLGIDENGELIETDDGKIDSGEFQGNFSILPLFNVLKYLECRDQGNPVDTVNHLHDKPLEVNMNVSLAETIAKARKRVSQK